MPRVAESVAGPEAAGKSCAVCQTGILAGERIVQCPSCALPYHAECWRENTGCAQYGCPSAPETIKSDPAPSQMGPALSWGGDKPCPACGKKIKLKAVKCRFCGAVFDSRDVMTRGDYEAREYSDREAVKARNIVVVLFLLSGTGVLSPILGVVTGLLVFRGACCGIEYRRLPPALRALAACAFGVCCLLSFMAFLLLAVDSA